MALADDITEAAAKAIAARDGEPWDRLRPLSRSYYYARARAAVAAALDTLAASEMPHTSGYRRVDFEELAADVREVGGNA